MGPHTDTHHTAAQPPTEPHPAPGPRQAAARKRRRRTAAITTAAAGAVLLLGGTATAAVLLTDPDQATSATLVPEADPDPLTSAASPDPDAAQQARQATEQAHQSATAQGPALPPAEPDPAPAAGGGEDPQPTGQGGTCQASHYGAELAGSATANGETFDPSALTAAHKTLPFNTMVQVTNPGTGASVTVRINDRGPFISGRCLDLSTTAFEQIFPISAGVGTVDWQVVG
ncbi:septal ring lytic transglycosylase RlpA family protein [Nocardiopsis sp. LOL_012]|uniref:septal ring lytic transglycosylase RlpA family protein n=1 Tax=Nocardiopsis sp. LOL_012 TaxID=3345409 RepID=UPI003A880202